MQVPDERVSGWSTDPRAGVSGLPDLDAPDPVCRRTVVDGRYGSTPREWAEHVVHDYNTRHHHSSLAGFTPEQVHTGTWVDVHTERQAVLDAQYAANPERYRGRRPIAATTPEITQLNPT